MNIQLNLDTRNNNGADGGSFSNQLDVVFGATANDDWRPDSSMSDVKHILQSLLRPLIDGTRHDESTGYGHMLKDLKQAHDYDALSDLVDSLADTDACFNELSAIGYQIETIGKAMQQISSSVSDSRRRAEADAKRKAAAAKRRDKAQAEYVDDFHGAVLGYLAFHADYAVLAEQMARAVADHATPVGSGTVARTKRIPIEQRAEAAVIAWMRHQTTGYDGMVVPRVKGKRREVRRQLAAQSKHLLARYRSGEANGEECPLQRALKQPETTKAPS